MSVSTFSSKRLWLFSSVSKIVTVSFLLSLTGSFCFAQKPLTNSRQSSFYTYIYRLKPEDVLKFYKFPDQHPDESILKNPIDSFKTDKYWENNLPAGNYLKVYADKNKLEYKLIENHTLWLRILPNEHELSFVFIDKPGNVVDNALVRINNKTVSFNSKIGLYNVHYSKKDTLMQVEYAGVTNFFSIKQQNYSYSSQRNLFVKAWRSIKNRIRRPIYYFKYRPPFYHYYSGFMVFNKPKYKPYDTVKFKAFILNGLSKKPLTAPRLLIRLRENYGKDGKIIGSVNSYRQGGYEYSFVLSDSLKLSLDEKYTISLEDPISAKYNLDKYDGNNEEKFLAKRKVYLTGQFDYEDYELKTINFNLRADKLIHSPGNPLAIYFKATDENNLPVPDGRIELTLTKNSVHRYKDNHVFVPDILWKHKLNLDPVGETKVVIPDSIFPKADINYEISANFLNSDNEFQSKSLSETYDYNKYDIDARLKGDTLVASYRDNGKECKTAAFISALNKSEDTISKVKVMLPCRMIINPNVAAYSVETDSTDAVIEIGKSESGLSLSGDRTADSLFVTVKNNNNLHFWYSVFAGNSLIDEGQADSLFYKRAYSGRPNITFVVNYLWGGESKTEQTTVGYADKLLTINVKQPLSVYPGQQVKTEIVVTDAKGKPASNTDLTAWALTGKFTEYSIPDVPYLGKGQKRKIKQSPIDLRSIVTDGSLMLNWTHWSKEMGLDSITYYEFTHPDSVYRIEEPGKDTVTQVAPFIVKDGDILPVHILYIDNRPVYFSQAQQLQRYSFRVTPGKHKFGFRTEHQSVTMDNVMVEKSKKLIFSLNISGPANRIVQVENAPDTLTYYEESQINKYMITVENNFAGKMALIQHGENFAFLNPDLSSYTDNNNILTGPIANNYALFSLYGKEKPVWFFAEPKYSYLFEPGLIKQTSIPTTFPFTKVLKNIKGADDYSQYVLTINETDTLWQQYMDRRSSTRWLFTNREVLAGPTGRLEIGLNEDKKTLPPFIKNVIIYRYDNPDYIRICPGVTVDFGNLEAGKYRLMFLLRGDSYDIVDNILVKPNGVNYYNIDVTPSHPKDSVSIKINEIIINRPGEFKDADRDIENDALKLKEAFNSKYFDDSGFGSTMMGRILSADDKSALPGCSIRVKGNNKGTVSDVNGKFRIKVPPFGKLVISFIGYAIKEIPIETRTSVDIKLDPDLRTLAEVNVVSIGYGTVKGSNLSASIQTLEGRASGVSITNDDASPGGSMTVLIRGIGSLSTNKPLYIVDGVPVDNPVSIDPNIVAEISVLKDAAATALYGIRAANGVVIITTKKKATAVQAAATASQSDTAQTIRKNFSDYAYWQPKLTTDADGRASFTTTFPDDITSWRTFVIGINGQKQSGYVEHQIKSFKPLSAAFISPLFAVQGDELSTIGKVMNYNTDPAKVTGSFTYNGKLIKQENFEVQNAKIDTFKVTVPAIDSLAFEYSIKRDNGYFDGERRKIPVVEQGVKETKGVFEVLNADTSINMKFDPALGPITLRAEASVLPALAEEAQHLREYKYLCNEQLASKLKGLLAEKRIKNYLNQPFKYEKNILEVIKKLQENRRTQGTWGWWKDTDEELWISLHAVEALTDAKKEGYTIDIDEKKLTDYLVYQLESYKGEEKLACLQLLHKLGAKVDYPKYFTVITKEYVIQKQVTRYDRFRLMLLQQEAGLTVKMDSLLDTEHHTLFGNVYWGEDSYRFFDNSIQLGVLAYQIIKNDGKHPALLEKIRGYFLEQRRMGEWRNTYESSLILENILPDLLKESKQVKPVTLVIRGSKTDTIRKFPYNTTLTDLQLNIIKTGSLPVYITGYQQFWNPKPEKVSKEFTVDTWFEKKGEHLTSLKGGETVQLKARITVKGDADYVMVEIPIPAGCSYESKEQSWENNEVHREYFKEKVSIFCRKLKEGNYEFTVNLTPRYDGKYNLNPAKAEMMYFPVFYGREGMKKVMIGE